MQKAAVELASSHVTFTFSPVKTPGQLALCHALVIPGGESTTMALIAERSGLLEPLRRFVKVDRFPTWGTCAGMILLAESANRTKKGGQELIGGLDVRVNRNHFGRQVESFSAPLRLRFLGDDEKEFLGVFIRAPVVEALLPGKLDVAPAEVEVRAPALGQEARGEVEILAELHRGGLPKEGLDKADRPLADGMVRVVDKEREREREGGDARVVAVRQGNVVGTSFHPELTGDARMHRWWLDGVAADALRRAAAS